MARGIIDIEGTDSNGNAGMTVRVTDDDGVLLENIKITGEDAENDWTEVVLYKEVVKDAKGEEVGTRSLTAYKSGRTCILKGVNLKTPVGYRQKDSNGEITPKWYCMANFDNAGKYKSMFLPKTNVFWYDEITLLQTIIIKTDKAKLDREGNIIGWDAGVQQKINNPYQMSFGLKTNGELYNLLKRDDLTSHTTVDGINFTITYLV